MPRNTHNLDLADACHFAAELFKHLGDTDRATLFSNLSDNWVTAYDKKLKYLKRRGHYYEGSYVTYSFRIAAHSEERIKRLGTAKFEELLDKFFGLNKGARNAPRYKKPMDSKWVTPRFNLWNRFQGLNNEPDMETMYNYHLIQKPQKARQIVASAMNNFAATEGGIPGNEDSGGLSSWYVFNAMGIFPRVGTDTFFVGTPIFKKITVRALAQTVIELTVIEPADNGILVNGKFEQAPSLTLSTLKQ